MRACEHAFTIGAEQELKTPLTQYQLFARVDWVRGYHKTLIWAAYKSGLWERDH